MSSNSNKRISLLDPLSDSRYSAFVEPEMVKAVGQVIASVNTCTSYVLFVCYVFQVIKTGVRPIAIKMINLHSFRTRANKRLHNKNVNLATTPMWPLAERYLRAIHLVFAELQDVPARIFKRMVRMWLRVTYTTKITYFKRGIVGNSSPYLSFTNVHNSNSNTALAYFGATI